MSKNKAGENMGDGLCVDLLLIDPLFAFQSWPQVVG